MKKKIVPKLRQEVKVKVDIVTSDEIKIYYTGKFQDFTARYLIKMLRIFLCRNCSLYLLLFQMLLKYTGLARAKRRGVLLLL